MSQSSDLYDLSTMPAARLAAAGARPEPTSGPPAGGAATAQRQQRSSA